MSGNARPKRIVAWNIRHGGGIGDRQRRVMHTLLHFDADILVVSEFRVGEAGRLLVEALVAAGYEARHPPNTLATNTILIASRTPFLSATGLDEALPDPRHLWKANCDWVSLVGVYMPVSFPKLIYWQAVVRAAAARDAPDLFIGDFNTGTNTLDRDEDGTAFVGSEYMERMTSTGFIDLWRTRNPREREYTWLSPQARNGFRLDHAFGSAQVDAAVVSCHYDHRPRIAGISDHSALVIEMKLPLPRSTCNVAEPSAARQTCPGTLGDSSHPEAFK